VKGHDLSGWSSIRTRYLMRYQGQDERQDGQGPWGQHGKDSVSIRTGLQGTLSFRGLNEPPICTTVT
jgi:hypothetical protein